MPFALTLIGLILIITGFQNTYKEFGSKVQGDFSGPGNFIYWLVSVGIVGGLGYIKGLETFSRAFMTLILIALIINMYKKNPNVFTDIGSGISSGSTSQVDPIGAPLAGGGVGGAGGGTGTGDLSLLSSADTVISGLTDIIGF